MKKRKNCDVAEVRRASFTTLVVSVNGVLGREAECFVKLLAEKMEKIISRSSRMDKIFCQFEGHKLMPTAGADSGEGGSLGSKDPPLAPSNE